VALSSDEYVLDQLCICEEKLLRLMEELQTSGNDVDQLMRQMEAEEVSLSVFFHLSALSVCQMSTGGPVGRIQSGQKSGSATIQPPHYPAPHDSAPA